MNATWKGFWRGVLAVLSAIAAGIAYFLIRRGKTPSKPPAEIAADAEAQIAAKREEIKSDSDQALADRFNTIAKKENPK